MQPIDKKYPISGGITADVALTKTPVADTENLLPPGSNADTLALREGMNPYLRLQPATTGPGSVLWMIQHEGRKGAFLTAIQRTSDKRIADLGEYVEQKLLAETADEYGAASTDDPHMGPISYDTLNHTDKTNVAMLYNQSPASPYTVFIAQLSGHATAGSTSPYKRIVFRASLRYMAVVVISAGNAVTMNLYDLFKVGTVSGNSTPIVINLTALNGSTTLEYIWFWPYPGNLVYFTLGSHLYSVDVIAHTVSDVGAISGLGTYGAPQYSSPSCLGTVSSDGYLLFPYNATGTPGDHRSKLAKVKPTTHAATYVSAERVWPQYATPLPNGEVGVVDYLNIGAASPAPVKAYRYSSNLGTLTLMATDYQYDDIAYFQGQVNATGVALIQRRIAPQPTYTLGLLDFTTGVLTALTDHDSTISRVVNCLIPMQEQWMVFALSTWPPTVWRIGSDGMFLNFVPWGSGSEQEDNLVIDGFGYNFRVITTSTP